MTWQIWFIGCLFYTAMRLEYQILKNEIEQQALEPLLAWTSAILWVGFITIFAPLYLFADAAYFVAGGDHESKEK